MHLRTRTIVIGCIMMGIALAACGPGSPHTAPITPAGQTDAPSMPQPEQVTATTTLPEATQMPPSPSSTPSPPPLAATATMVPGPLPDKGWPTGYFGPYAATWSPTRAELLLDGCKVGGDGLYLAAAPGFTPILLVSRSDRAHEESDGGKYCYGGAGWSPSGEHVLYMTAGPEYAIGVTSRYGTNARTIEGDFQKYYYDVDLSHPQWFSQQTLMLNVFKGVDAHYLNYLIDINTTGAQKVGEGQEVLREPSSTLEYVALDTWLMSTWHYAAVISLVEENDYWDDRSFGGYDSVSALNLHYWREEGDVEDSFMDWRPGSNQMLIRAQQLEGTQEFDLVLWNVDKDTDIVAAPGGISGEFSPDGSLLAYVKPNDKGMFDLQILDMNSLIITHVYPLSVEFSYGQFPAGKMAFSPDGRYLAFTSPATAETGTKTLNLFDLNARQIVFMVPVAKISTDNSQIPLWSPDGHALAFYDSEAKLSILDVGTRTQVRVQDIVSPEILAPDNLQWSYDGRYASVRDSNGDVWIIEVP
ncbi:MAG: PD40 domain-containing protein [Anaerolineae bacterium]|nr:PD40 domain-containing protein [Anaerolineae bacterium]